MFRPLLLLFAGLLALAGCGSGPETRRGPLVLAAASLQEAMTQAADAWAAKGHARPTLSFAASSALARQVLADAPADLFLSADEEWMEAAERGGKLRAGTRRPFLGNRLVLIAPANATPPASIAAALSGLGDGRLAMADPDAVPAGRYGKAALTSLGLWTGVERRIAGAENVRAALLLVERGDAPLGVVYETDARASRRVRVVAPFPAGSHPPIIYPIALLAASAAPEARGFYDFLLSPEGRAIFARHGFTEPAR
ncbi:MAG TPA: molybdate ABC transporter substrate-binding protein [Allosphingosinicella sp.]|nr:molybdate ABC transporter substrate-binding protein [Allosphingosinicella sp.]